MLQLFDGDKILTMPKGCVTIPVGGQDGMRKSRKPRFQLLASLALGSWHHPGGDICQGEAAESPERAWKMTVL